MPQWCGKRGPAPFPKTDCESCCDKSYAAPQSDRAYRRVISGQDDDDSPNAAGSTARRADKFSSRMLIRQVASGTGPRASQTNRSVRLAHSIENTIWTKVSNLFCRQRLGEYQKNCTKNRAPQKTANPAHTVRPSLVPARSSAETTQRIPIKNTVSAMKNVCTSII